MRVVIAGAGIGGLAAAIAFRRAGHETVVLERAPRLEAVGAGITLFGNATRALGLLGVRDAIAARGAPAQRSAIMTADGAELSELPADLLDGAVAVHRADLQAALAAEAGEVRLAAEVTSVEQDRHGVTARTSDGAVEHGDLLVGADGLQSRVRDAVAEARPRYAGYTAWRGISPVAIEPGRLTESWGVGERFGLVDIGRDRTYWFATKNAVEGEPEEPGGRRAEILRRFGGWHEPIDTVVKAAEDDVVLRNDVYYLPPLERWSNGRVVLLGDAAHATTPGVGQGAAMAIEDAVVLVQSVAGGRDLGAAFAAYETLRRRRTQNVLKMSRRTDRAAQLAHPFACRVRNAAVRRMPTSMQRRQLGPIVRHLL